MKIWNAVAPKKHKYLWAWIAMISAIYFGIGIMANSVVHGEKKASATNHELRMTAGKVEQGLTPPDAIPEQQNFTPVSVGIYLDGIESFSIRDSFWTTTFYIWFRWKGDPAINPGKSFQLIDATIDKKLLVEEYFGVDGTNYQRFRVTAKVTKFFNTTRVPLDDHMLNLYIEDNSRDTSALRYVADDTTALSSRVKISGYYITGVAKVVKSHTYKTGYGDPRAAHGEHKTFSQFVFAISVKRANLGVYFKVFIGLFAGMLLTFTSFAVRASEAAPRVAMAVASYFGAVANSYLVVAMLPTSGQFGLVEYVSFLGLFTIFTCLAATVLSMYIWNTLGDKELSRAFDKASATTIGFGYVAINLVLPFSAYYST